MKTILWYPVHKVSELIHSACIHLLRLASYLIGGMWPMKFETTRNPTSVNYHFTRKCNYKCGFCFHTAKTSFVLPIDEAKRGLRMLKESALAQLHCINAPYFQSDYQIQNQPCYTKTSLDGIVIRDYVHMGPDEFGTRQIFVWFHSFTRDWKNFVTERVHTKQNELLPCMEKINFSGGEPFIEGRQGNFVGEMVRYSKEELGLSVSIVSNGSLIKEQWFKDYGEYLDILAISCDSFDEEINRKIGRHHSKEKHLNILRRVRDWCIQYQVAFKINTVVNSYNRDEDMSEAIIELNPMRWKVFQCLLIEGENVGEDALRNAEEYVISDEEFHSFISRHSHVPCLVPESNEKMRNSYLILDEYMRFLDNTTGSKVPSKSILDVGVQAALNASGFDEKMFFKRGGKYVWSKGDMLLDW